MSEELSGIVPSREYVEGLKGRYPGLKYREEVLRRWFCPAEKIFFDVDEGEERTEGLKKVLNRRNFASFTVFFVVRRGSEEYELMNSSFKNLGGKTMANFANTYYVNLEYMTRLSVQMRRLEYLECVGFSYSD